MSNALIFGLYPQTHPYFIQLNPTVIENILKESGISNLPSIVEDKQSLAPMYVSMNHPNTIFYNNRFRTIHGAVLHEYGHILYNNSIRTSLNKSLRSSRNRWDTFIVNAEYHADEFAIKTMQKMNRPQWLSAYLTMMLYNDDYILKRYSHNDTIKQSRSYESVNPHWISAKRHFKQKRSLFYKFVGQDVIAHKIPYSYRSKIAM
jgi:hypothetical protein